MRPENAIYHNLPQPDYGEFVGREGELAQIFKLLRPYPQSRHHLIVIDGIGGIGKSSLALEIAYRCLQASIQTKLQEDGGDSTYLTLLRQTLIERFSEDELQTLCFDLALDYEMLPGQGKGGKARELVAYLNRRNRLGELAEIIQQSRSDILLTDKDQEEKAAEAEEFDAIIWTSAKSNYLTADGIAPRRQIIRTLDDIYTAISIALKREDITRAKPSEQDQLVQRALTRQKTLLIIDNLETIDDGAVNSFLRELPAPTKCIVTTRHRIDIAYSVRLVGMSWHESQLLIKNEAELKNVFLNERQSKHLFERTGGLPLALVWSIAQMGFGDSVESVLTRLGQPTGNVALFCFGETLSKVKGNYSYHILLALTLFVTDASREALGYIANLPTLDRDDGIKELINLSLINAVVKQDIPRSKSADYDEFEETVVRFTLLPLTRHFAQQELSAQKEHDLRIRQADYYLDILQGATLKDKWGRYFAQLEGSNFADLIDYLIQAEEITLVIAIFRRYYPFLWREGHWARGINLALTVLSWAEENDDRSIRAQCNHWLGRLYLYQGQYEKAERCARQACDLYIIEDWQWLSVHAYLAQILLRQGRFQEAIDSLNKSLPVALERHDYRGATRIYNAFAEIELQKQIYDAALDFVISGHQYASGQPEQTTVIGLNCYLRAKIQRKRGKLEDAEKWILKFKELADKERFIQEMAQANLELAHIMYLQGKLDQAIMYVLDAQNVFERLGMPNEKAESLALLEKLKSSNQDGVEAGSLLG